MLVRASVLKNLSQVTKKTQNTWSISNKSNAAQYLKTKYGTSMKIQSRWAHTGTVSYFNKDKGFGFIKPQSGEADVFIHVSAIKGVEGFKILNLGDVIEYEFRIGEKGPIATDAKIIKSNPRYQRRPREEEKSELEGQE